MGERAEQRVAGPEHGTRANDRRTRKYLLDRAFAPSARADVRRTGVGIGADAGNEDKAGDTGSNSLPCERLGALLVHGLERHASRLDIGGYRIDNGVGTGEGGGDRGLIAHVGGEDRNQVQARRVQRAARAIGMPDRDAYSRSLGSEAPHKASTQEAGAPEHADREMTAATAHEAMPGPRLPMAASSAPMSAVTTTTNKAIGFIVIPLPKRSW